MEEFGCARQLVKLGLAHFTIGTSAKVCIMKEVVVLIAKGLPLCLLGHFSEGNRSSVIDRKSSTHYILICLVYASQYLANATSTFTTLLHIIRPQYSWLEIYNVVCFMCTFGVIEATLCGCLQE